MPRRIPDYPDAFAGWNLVASFGSIVTVVSLIVFGYNIYLQLVSHITVGNNPWSYPQYFENMENYALYSANTHTSLEWTLMSPPAVHSYDIVPKQS